MVLLGLSLFLRFCCERLFVVYDWCYDVLIGIIVGWNYDGDFVRERDNYVVYYIVFVVWFCSVCEY